MRKLVCFFVLPLLLISACQKLPIDDNLDDTYTEDLYFPPITGNDWASINPEMLEWNTSAIEDLISFLDQSSTRGFILLKDGKIAIEHYRGKTLIGMPFNQRSNWYWASAGKTLTASLIGIAQDEGFLDIQDASSEYLGEGWSSLDPLKEKNIRIVHHLSMTTGLDEKAENGACVDPECFVYKSEVGTRWAYHNGPYTILDQIIENATDTPFDDYFDSKIKKPIGMDGNWRYIGDNHVFFSTPRSMARFGLMILNDGKWKDQTIVPSVFLNEMTNPSQEINNAYGYLWWLNGYQPIMMPGLQWKLRRTLTPSAPTDMIAAMGKNAQYLNIVPSKGLVMVRMGENPNDDLVPLNFQEELWQHINKIIE